MNQPAAESPGRSAGRDAIPALPEGWTLEDLFLALLRDSPNHIYFKDRDSRFVLVGAAQARWLGLSDPGEAVGRTDGDFFLPDHALAARADEEALLRGAIDHLSKEERETWPDGRETWVRTTKFALRRRAGERIGTFGISTDITARHLAEAGLQAALDRLHQLERIINRSPSVALLRGIEPSWPVRYVSDNIVQFGYPPEEFAAGRLAYADLIEPPDRERAARFVRERIARGVETFDLVYRIRTRGGAVRWVEERTRIGRDASGRPTHLEGVATDITEKRVAQALQESEKRYRRLIDSVTDYAYEAVVRGGRVVRTRHGAGCEAVTGYRPEDYEADSYLWFNMVHPEDREAVLRSVDRILSGGEAEPLEHRILRRNGSERWVRHTPVPRRDAKGRLVGYDGLIKDITERRLAEQGRRAMERKVQEAREQNLLERAHRLGSLGLLASGVAHEVNNPLQGMLSHVDNARRALPADSPARRSLDMVERGIQSIATLVQRLLRLGAADEPGVQRTRFRETAGFVRDLVGRQMEASGVRLTLSDRTPDPALAISRDDLVQVLLNLLLNARDAMPGGGAVTVDIEVAAAEAAIRVADTGPGIPADRLPMIFTPFFTTKGPRGTGLGLAVTESLVRACGGRIEAESEPGRGTVFVLRLPLSPEDGS